MKEQLGEQEHSILKRYSGRLFGYRRHAWSLRLVFRCCFLFVEFFRWYSNRRIIVDEYFHDGTLLFERKKDIYVFLILKSFMHLSGFDFKWKWAEGVRECWLITGQCVNDRCIDHLRLSTKSSELVSFQFTNAIRKLCMLFSSIRGEGDFLWVDEKTFEDLFDQVVPLLVINSKRCIDNFSCAFAVVCL